MANRHLSRSIAVQVLFELDFNNCQGKKEKIGDALERSLKEFAPGIEDKNFAENLVKEVLKKRKKIDSIIEKTAPEWPIGQIALVDRNVLRVGLYELLFGNKKEVPPKVAINEAIELAKTFGGETSGKFVNGVLGTVYKEIGGDEKDSRDEIAGLEKLGGAVVYKKDPLEFALVHDVFGYWTLSKGHIEESEDEKAGAAREIKEELGIDVEIEEELGKNEYIASHPEKGRIKKSVVYFLAKTGDKELKLGDSGGLDDARWFKPEELEGLTIYDDLKPIIIKAINALKDKK
ncbi:transcription antitermination factor NusB [Patescibacteria group bacterium]|nr:transcription antitermination factor NusB [Patescibacteria group bacterium]